MPPYDLVFQQRLAGGDVIPDPDEGEEDEDICARDWEKMRAGADCKGRG
jgi:hypothetical protein